jgi:hypothetical protein
VLVFRGHTHGLADGTHAVLAPSVVIQQHLTSLAAWPVRERQLSLHAFPVLVFRGHTHGLADGTHAVLTPSVMTQKHPAVLTVFHTTRGRGAATHVHQKNFRRGTVGHLAFAVLSCAARGMRKEEEAMLLILDTFSTSLCCKEETGLCCKALHCLCFCGPQVGKKE